MLDRKEPIDHLFTIEIPSMLPKNDREKLEDLLKDFGILFNKWEEDDKTSVIQLMDDPLGEENRKVTGWAYCNFVFDKDGKFNVANIED